MQKRLSLELCFCEALEIVRIEPHRVGDSRISSKAARGAWSGIRWPVGARIAVNKISGWSTVSQPGECEDLDCGWRNYRDAVLSYPPPLNTWRVVRVSSQWARLSHNCACGCLHIQKERLQTNIPLWRESCWRFAKSITVGNYCKCSKHYQNDWADYGRAKFTPLTSNLFWDKGQI